MTRMNEQDGTAQLMSLEICWHRAENTWLLGRSWFQIHRDQYSSNVLDASALLQPTMMYCNEEFIQCKGVSKVMLPCYANC